MGYVSLQEGITIAGGPPTSTRGISCITPSHLAVCCTSSQTGWLDHRGPRSKKFKLSSFPVEGNHKTGC